MSTRDNLRQALLASFKCDAESDEAAADALADVMLAFAAAVRGEPPVLAELAPMEYVPDQTPTLVAAVRTLTDEIRLDREERARVERLAGRAFSLSGPILGSNAPPEF